MSNGHLTNDGTGGLAGVIETMEHYVKVKLQPFQSKNPEGPVFEIFAQGRSGNLVKVGAAWEKKAKETGEIFYSMTLDDPSFSTPLNVTAFKGQGFDNWDIVWRRPRQQQAA